MWPRSWKLNLICNVLWRFECKVFQCVHTDISHNIEWYISHIKLGGTVRQIGKRQVPLVLEQEPSFALQWPPLLCGCPVASANTRPHAGDTGIRTYLPKKHSHLWALDVGSCSCMNCHRDWQLSMRWCPWGHTRRPRWMTCVKRSWLSGASRWDSTPVLSLNIQLPTETPHSTSLLTPILSHK